MHRRLAKELPRLRAKTLLRDGLAVEDDCPEYSPSTAAHGRGGAPKLSFVALLAGPRDSPYEGGVFRLQVAVPPQYPLEPPSIRFKTCVFHPNVGRGHTPGAICLDILRKEAWSPALTLERTLLSIASLLADPNPASPMDSEAARLYEHNRPAYDKRVREWVRKHAAPAGVGSTWAGDFGKEDSEEEVAAGVHTVGGKSLAKAVLEADKKADKAPAAATTVRVAASELFEPLVIDVSDDEADLGQTPGKRPRREP